MADDEMKTILGMFSKFFNQNTKWSEVKALYPILTQYLKNGSFNDNVLSRAVNNKYETLLLDQSFHNIFQHMLIIWVLIFIVGSISNGIVILVLTRVDNKSVYDIICVGLAVTDLLMLIVVVPITTMRYWFSDYSHFNDMLCPFVNFVIYVALFSSASMLLTLTVTRFLSVVHPWQNRMISAKEAKIACCIAWIVGGLCSVPVAIYFDVENKNSNNSSNNTQVMHWPSNNGVRKCKDLFPNQTIRTTYSVLVFLMTYLLPFMSIIIMNYMIVSKLKHEVNQVSENPALILKKNSNLAPCSSRETRKRQVRNRVTKMVILVTTLYCVCWLPTQLVNIWYYTNPQQFPMNRGMQYIKFISQTLSFASTCINPLVYSIVNETFKIAAKKQFPCFFRVVKRNSTMTVQSCTTSLLQSPQLPIAKNRLQKSTSDNSLVKINEPHKSHKKSKANIIQNRNVLAPSKVVEETNSKSSKKIMLSLAVESKKSKISYSPHIESQASCSVFSFEGFTDNLDSTVENTNYNLITKV